MRPEKGLTRAVWLQSSLVQLKAKFKIFRKYFRQTLSGSSEMKSGLL